MGRIYEALQRAGAGKGRLEPWRSESDRGPDILTSQDAGIIELERAHSLTVRAVPEHRLITLAGDPGMGAEKIRIIAARLRHLQQQRPLKRVLIASTVKSEGKTVIAANIAIALATTKQRVLLIDGDCHQPGAARILDANGAAGLMEWWRSEGAIGNYLLQINHLPLWFLPAGKPSEQPLEMLQSGRLSHLINRMSNWFDWIIIDSPPCAPLADAAVWATLADGTLLVTRERTTPKRLLKKVLDSLDRQKLLGIILNECSDPDQRYYTHYYVLRNKR